MRSRDELLKEAEEYKGFADRLLYATDDMQRAQVNATLALTCTLLAEAQKTETRSLTVEDVEKAMDEALEDTVYVVQSLGDVREFHRAFALWKQRTITHLKGGSHER